MSTFVPLKIKYNDDVRRLSIDKTKSFAFVKDLIMQSFNLVLPTITFTDDEGDLCNITNDVELKEAFDCHQGATLTLQVSAAHEKDVDDQQQKFVTKAPKAPAAAAATVERKVPDVLPGRSNRDNNWRRGSSGGKWRRKAQHQQGRRQMRQEQSWRQSSGRAHGAETYEFGDVTRTFHRHLTDPNGDFAKSFKSLAEASHVAAGVLGLMGEETVKFWNSQVQPSVHQAGLDLADFAQKLHDHAMRLLHSKKPYEWKKLAAQGNATAKEIMQSARREADLIQKQFMRHARVEANQVFREAMEAVKRMAQLDWKMTVDKAVRDAKSTVKTARLRAQDLVKQAKQRRKQQQQKDKQTKEVWESSSEEDEGKDEVEAAKAKKKELNKEARKQKEIDIQEARVKANEKRRSVVKKAREQANLLKQQMIEVAKKEGKALRKAVVDEARVEAKKNAAGGSSNSTPVVQGFQQQQPAEQKQQPQQNDDSSADADWLSVGLQHLAVGRLGYNYLNSGSAADNNASAPLAADGASAPSLPEVEVVASSATDAAEQAPPKEEQPYQYASALSVMRDMGFQDEEAAKIALDMHGGQVQQAVMAILSQP